MLFGFLLRLREIYLAKHFQALKFDFGYADHLRWCFINRDFTFCGNWFLSNFLDGFNHWPGHGYLVGRKMPGHKQDSFLGKTGVCTSLRLYIIV